MNTRIDEAWRLGQQLGLRTGYEMEMFRVFYVKLGEVVRKETFMELVFSEAESENILKVYIYRLRQAFRHTDWRIETHWRLGYALHGPIPECRAISDIP